MKSDDLFSYNPVVNRFLNYMAYNKSYAHDTVVRYGRFLERLADWLASLYSPHSLLSVDTYHLEQWSGLELHKQKLKPQSRKVAVAALRRFYAWALKNHLVKSNPALDLPTPKVGTAIPVAAKLSDAQSLLVAPDINTFIGLRDATMLSVLIGTGCRVSGLVSLNDSGLLWTEGGSHKTGRLSIRLLEKGKKERVVPAPLETALLMRLYLNHQELQKLSRRLPNGDCVLFVNCCNTTVATHERFGEALRIRADSFGAILKRYGKGLGLDNRVLHPHAFRHLYGVELAESDVDLIARQMLLGHASPDTTGIYSHLALRKMQTIVDRANPLAKIRTPISELANQLRAAHRRIATDVED